MGTSVINMQSQQVQTSTLSEATIADRAQGSNTLPQSQIAAAINADPAREAIAHQQSQGRAQESKDDLALLQHASKTVALSRTRDDSELASNPSIDALQKAGVDVSNYTKALLDSPQLFEALKIRNLLVIDEGQHSLDPKDKADKKETAENQKAEIRALVHDLNNKLLENKPLIPSTDLQSADQLAFKTDKIAESLKNQGQQALGEQLAADNHRISNNPALTDKEKIAQTTELIRNNSEFLKQLPGSDPIIKNISTVLDELVKYLESDKVKESDEAQESDKAQGSEKTQEAERKTDSGLEEQPTLKRSQSQGANAPTVEQPTLRRTASEGASPTDKTLLPSSSEEEGNASGALQRSQSQGANAPITEQPVLRRAASEGVSPTNQEPLASRTEEEVKSDAASALRRGFSQGFSQGNNNPTIAQSNLTRASSEGNLSALEGSEPLERPATNTKNETAASVGRPSAQPVENPAADDSALSNNNDITKQVNSKALESAGVALTGYSESLLTSPELYKALKDNNLLLLEEDTKLKESNTKELTSKQEKIDKMVEGFASAKSNPIASKVNLEEVPKLQKIISALSKELETKGAKEIGQELQKKSAAITDNKRINYEEKVKQLTSLLEKSATQLATDKTPKGAKDMASDVRNLADFLSLQQKTNHLDEDLAAKKQQVKDIVNDLNKKLIFQQPLVADADMNNLTQLSEKIHRLSEVIQNRGATEVADHLQQKANEILNDGSLRDKEKTAKMASLVHQIADELKGTPAKEIAATIHGFADQIQHADTKEKVEEKKKTVHEDLEFLEKPGSKRAKKKTALLHAKVNNPFSAVRVSGERGHDVSRKTTGGVDISRQTTGSVGVMAGFKGDSLTGNPETTIAIAEATASYSHKRTNTFSSDKELLQDIAEDPTRAKKTAASGLDDRASSLLSRAKSKNDGVRAHMNDLHHTAQKQNAIRNNTEKLSNDLQQLGVLKEGEMLRLPEGQIAEKMSAEKAVHTGALKGSAALGRFFAPGATASGSLTGEAKVNVSTSYEATLARLLKNDDEREKAIAKYKLTDVAELNKELENLTGNDAESLTKKALILETVKDKILENLSELDHYESSLRKKDVQEKGSRVSALQQRMIDRLSTNPTSEHIQIERELGTKGRTQTLDKLQTKHAALMKLYKELNKPVELTQNKDNTKTSTVSTQESQLNQTNSANQTWRLNPLTTATLERPDNKRVLDQLGIDTTETKERLQSSNKDAFDTMLEQANADLHKPNVNLSEKTKKAMHIAKNERTQDVTAKFSVSANFAGTGVAIDGSYTKPIFAKPGATESSMEFSLKGEGVLGSTLARGIRDRIVEETGQDIPESTWQELADALTAYRVDMVTLIGNTGLKAAASIDVSIKDNRITAVKVNVQTTQNTGLRIPLGIGRVEVGAERSQVTPQKIIMGANSLANAKERFDTIKANGHLEIKEAGKKDDWTVMIQENKTQLMKIAKSFADPDSGPIKDLNKVIDEFHYPALYTDSATEMDKKQTYYDAYGTDGPNTPVENGAEVANEAKIELDGRLDQRIKEIMMTITQFSKVDPNDLGLDAKLSGVKEDLAIFDSVAEKSPEFEEALTSIKDNLTAISETSDQTEIDEKLASIQSTFDSFKSLFSAKVQLTNKKEALIEKSKELNKLTDPEKIEEKYKEIMDELKAFFVLQVDKVKKPDIEAL